MSLSMNRKLRILGVAVHTIDLQFAGMPLWRYSMSFGYLKAYLAKFPIFADVVFDTHNYYQNESSETITAAVLKHTPDMVLFSAYVWNFRIYQRLARAIKKANPEIQIVLGGPEVSEDTRAIMAANPAFDVIVRGEGEHVFYELVQRRLDGAGLADVRGITYRANQAIVRNDNSDPSMLNPIDVIPSVFQPEMFNWSEIAGSFAALESQRGCNFSCGFCRYRKIGEGARFFSLDRVLNELSFLKEVGIKHLYLMDPTFNNDIKRAKKILRHIIDIGLGATVNAEMVPEFMDAEILALSVEAGMENLEIGIQSVNKSALRVMQRPRDSQKLEERIKMAASTVAKGKQLKVIPQIIYGLPGETFDEFCRSFDFVYQLDLEEIEIFRLLVLRDTQFYRDKEQHGFVYEEAPPHRLIESASFSRDDMILAGKMGCVAMSTQYTLRRHMKQYCSTKNITPSRFFRDHLELHGFSDKLAYSFPIHSREQADVLVEVVRKIGSVLLAEGENKEIAAAIRRTELLFQVRASMIEKASPKMEEEYFSVNIGPTLGQVNKTGLRLPMIGGTPQTL